MKKTSAERFVVLGVAVLIVALGLSGCSSMRSSSTPQSRHISLTSAHATGPAIGRGGAGCGSSGDWISAGTLAALNYEDFQELADLDGSTMGDTAGVSVPDASLPENDGVGSIKLGYGDDTNLGSEMEGFNPDSIGGDRTRADQLSGTLLVGAGLETIYFGFDSSEIRQDQWDKLQKNAGVIEKYPNAAVIVEGHCDERGTEEYNLGLSDRRAESIRKALISLGVDASRMTSVPYGESSPVDPRNTEEAWAKNRRVQFGDSTLQVSSL